MSPVAVYVARLLSVVLVLYGLAVGQSLIALAIFPAVPAPLQPPASTVPAPIDARIGYTV